MKANEFLQIADDLGLARYGTALCGVVDNWPVMLLNSSPAQIRVFADRKRDNAAKKQIGKALKPYGGRLNWNNGVINFYFGSKKKLKGTYGDYVRTCLRELSATGTKPDDKCPICGRECCDTAVPIKANFRLAHRDCLQSDAEKLREKAEINQEKGSYLAGIIGAFIGMIIGTLPSLFGIIFLERIFSILFALIPICAYFGYKLFGGRMNKAALFISLIMAVIGVYALGFEQIIAGGVRDGYALRDILYAMPYFLRDGEVWRSITAESIPLFWFTALGVLFAWGFISRTAEGKAKNALSILDLAVPYPAQNDGYTETEEFETVTE